MKKYRVGLIGCGGIANAHAKAYLDLNLKIAAAADINTHRLKEFGELYNIKNLYTDYKAMLREEKLDIVSICTWPPLHCEMTVRAAEEGVKGILCEKPMATCLAEADRMIRACRESGAKLAIGHMRRFLDIYVKAKKLSESHVMGEPFFIRGVSAGDLLSDGTHLIDLIIFIAGDQPVNWVFGQIDAYEKRRRYGHYIEDSAIGYIEFKDGLRAFFETSQLSFWKPTTGKIGFTEDSFFKDLGRVEKINWWKKGSKYCSLQIYGTEGRIEVGEREQPQLRYKGKGDEDWQVPKITQKQSPFTLQIKALIESIEKDIEHPCSGEQGRRTLEIIMSVYESARRREIIILPLRVNENPLFEMIEKGEI